MAVYYETYKGNKYYRDDDGQVYRYDNGNVVVCPNINNTINDKNSNVFYEVYDTVLIDSLEDLFNSDSDDEDDY